MLGSWKTWNLWGRKVREFRDPPSFSESVRNKNLASSHAHITTLSSRQYKNHLRTVTRRCKLISWASKKYTQTLISPRGGNGGGRERWDEREREKEREIGKWRRSEQAKNAVRSWEFSSKNSTASVFPGSRITLYILVRLEDTGYKDSTII